MKRFIIGLLFLLLPQRVFAACTGSTPNWVTTPDYASVAACVKSASPGDVISISAGSATWSGTITLTRGVTLLGPGSGSLTITSTSTMIIIAPSNTALSNNELFRISGITFDGNNALTGSDTAFINVTVPGTSILRNLSISDNVFRNGLDTASTTVGIYTKGQVRGVIGNNTFNRIDRPIKVMGNNSAAEWAALGGTRAFGTLDNLFFETNTIQWTSAFTGTYKGWIEVGHAARIVVRYNTYDFANVTSPQEVWDVHGSQNYVPPYLPATQQYGSMVTEYYGNTITNANSQYSILNLRGGWGLVFNNIVTGSAKPDFRLASMEGSIDSITGYATALDNTYGWNNTVNGVESPFYVNSDFHAILTENARWYKLNTLFNGITQHGVGRSTALGNNTSNNVPTTDANGQSIRGDAFWVAATATATVSSTVIQAGKLYKYISGRWQQVYTPFTYPHPLLATQYWVSPTGAAAWSGCRSAVPLSGTAACSLATANLNAAAGDTIYLRSGTYSIAAAGAGIAPTNSGTSGNTITFMAYANETPIITGDGFPVSYSFGFKFVGNSYIVIHGITFQNIRVFGALKNRSNYNEIRNNTFYNDITLRQDGYNTSGIDFDSVFDCGDGSLACYNIHNWIHHNTFDGVWADTWCGENIDMIRLGGSYGLGKPDAENNYNSIENNVFSHATHSLMDSSGRFVTIRNNIFHNEPFSIGCTNWLKATSSTTLTIGTGSKALTVETGLTLSGFVVLLYTADPSNRAMTGTVTSYDSGTGALVVNITSTKGSGSYSSWQVGQTLVPVYTDATLNGKYAHRNLAITDDFGREGMYTLVESNRIGYGSNNAGNAGPTNLDAGGRKNIIRYNAIYGGMASGLYTKYPSGNYNAGIVTSTTSNSIGTGAKSFTVRTGLTIVVGSVWRIAATSDKRNAMYATVSSYDSGTGALAVSVAPGDTVGSGTYTDWVLWNNGASGAGDQRIYNNTFYGNGKGYDWSFYGTSGSYAFNNRAISQYSATTPAATANIIKNNLFYGNSADVCDVGLTIPCSPAAWDTVENNWFQANGNPLFKDPVVTNYSSLTLPDLTLQASSPAIDGASYLTLANGTGSSSTTLIVDDALFFQDGTWGSDLVRAAGSISADWIAVGTISNIAAISSINYSKNTITLATPLTWADNAPVWLYKNSSGIVVLSGTAPDYGAYEYTGLPAATCNKADVQVLIDQALEGDTVQVPAGNCTWTSGITFTKAISIIGAGIGQTNITMTGTDGYVFKYEPTLATVKANVLMRISGFSITYTNAYYTIWIMNGHDAELNKVRIDHNYIKTGAVRAIHIQGVIYGVADHNTFEDSSVSVDGYGDWAWANIPQVHGSHQYFYVEDNTFLKTGLPYNTSFMHGGAGSVGYVARYNSGSGWTENTWSFDIHGNQPSSYSYMKNEIYGNYIDLGVWGQGCMVDQRGGQLLQFFNYVAAGGGSATCSREEVPDAAAPFYGTNPYDMHAQNTYIWSNRQNGSTLVSHSIGPENCGANPPTAWLPNTPYGYGDCVFFTGDPNNNVWKNNKAGTSGLVEPNWAAVGFQQWTPADGTIYDGPSGYNGGWVNLGKVVSPIYYNIDIWAQTATGSFDGTGNASAGGGVGCGTLAARPATCTTGVGYWATDQSCTDLTGHVGREPASSIIGTLYKCTAPNTWTSYYTPYQYPHPLTTSGLPSAPTNVRVR